MIYTLGGISNITTIFDNENGYYPIIETDEYGFNNPKGLFAKGGVDIMLIGDSFAEGACVKPDETIASILRKSGFKTISLGKGGNGPLIELATLKEYAEPIEPKVVLWLHYAHDFDDLKEELFSHTTTIEEGEDFVVSHFPTHAEHFYDVRRLDFKSSVTRKTNGSCQVMMLVEGEKIRLETKNGFNKILAYAETFVIPMAADSFTLTNLGQGTARVINAFLK